MGLNKVSVCDDGTSARSHANLFGSSNVMFKAGLNIMNMKTKSFRLQQIFLQSEVQIHSSVNNSFIATGNVACDSNWHPKAAITLSALETDQDYYHEIKKNEKKKMSKEMVQVIFFAMDLILMYDSLLDECRVRSKAIFTSSVPPLKPKRPLCFWRPRKIVESNQDEEDSSSVLCVCVWEKPGILLLKTTKILQVKTVWILGGDTHTHTLFFPPLTVASFCIFVKYSVLWLSSALLSSIFFSSTFSQV